MSPQSLIRDFGLTPASSSLRWLIAADAIEELGRGDIAASIRAAIDKDYGNGATPLDQIPWLRTKAHG